MNNMHIYTINYQQYIRTTFKRYENIVKQILPLILAWYQLANDSFNKPRYGNRSETGLILNRIRVLMCTLIGRILEWGQSLGYSINARTFGPRSPYRLVARLVRHVRTVVNFSLLNRFICHFKAPLLWQSAWQPGCLPYRIA